MIPYRLTRERTAEVLHFTARPESVSAALGLLLVKGLSITCAEALAWGVTNKPERPAMYGEWTLAVDRGEG